MKKWNLFFRLFLSRLQPYLFLPRPNYYFFSVFCPEMFQNLLFSGRNQLFLVFPREGRTFFSSRRLGFVVPREGKNPCCPKALPLLSQGIIFVPRSTYREHFCCCLYHLDNRNFWPLFRPPPLQQGPTYAEFK